MGVILAAGSQVQVADKRTWLEIVIRSNLSGTKVMPLDYHNRLFLGKDGAGGYEPIPEDIIKAKPLFTGTVGVLGKKNKPLGRIVHSQWRYNDQVKEVSFLVNAEHSGLVDTVVMCDLGIAPDGLLRVPVLNMQTRQLISSEQDMERAERISLRFHGPVQTIPITDRRGGPFQIVGDTTSEIWADPTAVGLIKCAYDYGTSVRGFRGLDHMPHIPLNYLTLAKGIVAASAGEVSVT